MDTREQVAKLLDPFLGVLTTTEIGFLKDSLASLQSQRDREVVRTILDILQEKVIRRHGLDIGRVDGVIEGMKKPELNLAPGFMVTAEYRLGEMRGYNQALDDLKNGILIPLSHSLEEAQQDASKQFTTK